MNNMGSFSHPSKSRMERKIISTGMVITRSVNIERSGLGSGCLEDEEKDGRARSSANFEAWRDVDSRETRIDPAAPGSPEITIARIAKPS